MRFRQINVKPTRTSLPKAISFVFFNNWSQKQLKFIVSPVRVGTDVETRMNARSITCIIIMMSTALLNQEFYGSKVGFQASTFAFRFFNLYGIKESTNDC